jgi:hypothetical protein
VRLLSSFFLVAEALGTVLLWVLLWRDPAVARWFLPASVPADLIRTFLLADLVTFVVLPLAAGHGVFHRCRWTGPVLWLHAGGVINVAAWSLWQTISTGGGRIAPLVLLPLAAIAGWLAVAAAPRPQ